MTTASPRRPGFTLVEVLIGVLVLALGLLGLGAVLPVVVREQRNASDAVLGAAVAAAAERALLGREGFRPDSPSPTAWDVLLWQGGLNGFSPDNIGAGGLDRTVPYRWETRTWLVPVSPLSRMFNNAPRTASYMTQITNAVYRFNDQGTERDGLRTGDMAWSASDMQRFQRSVAVGQPVPPWDPPNTVREPRPAAVRLSVADRLWPNADLRTAEDLPLGRDPYRPQFVWDFVARRRPVGVQLFNVAAPFAIPGVDVGESVQVALFVRRIDLNIRVPRGTNPNTGEDYTLLDTLTGNVPDAALRRVPVAVDADGIPTGTGFDQRTPGEAGLRYSTIVALEADFANDVAAQPTAPRDVIRLFPIPRDSPSAARLVRFASVTGQKLVDNVGNIYTVRGLPDPDQLNTPSNGVNVVVDPPVPPGVVAVNSPAAQTTLSNGSVLRQVVFTPQIPAAVRVFTVTRPVGSPTAP